MSAMAAARKRPPTFTVSEYVDFDIDPTELEEAGWVYVGTSEDGQEQPSPTTVLDAVVAWHERAHDGPWRWCSHELCDELRGRGNA